MPLVSHLLIGKPGVISGDESLVSSSSVAGMDAAGTSATLHKRKHHKLIDFMVRNIQEENNRSNKI